MTETRFQFRIHGMDCAEEVEVLKRELGPLVGGADRLAFDILNGRMAVAGAAGPSPEAVIDAVARTGMRAEVWRGEPETAGESGDRRRARSVLTAASGLLAFAGFLVHAVTEGGFLAALGSEGIGIAPEVPALARALYGTGILAGVWGILPKAWLAARRLRPDMNLLMTVAVLGAVAIGEWFEAATVAFLFALSLALESWSVARARRAVAALMSLAPPAARLKAEDGTETEVAAAEVPIGATIVVRPGERVPLDGSVLFGSSDVNQAPITGESIPVAKGPGDEVFAGTINGNGALEIASTRSAGDTTLARIIRMVGEAQSRRAPSEQWVEKFARIYTPAVFTLAVAFLLVPPALFGGAWSDWIYRALVLLVIGCPCALVISTPVSVVAALAAAAREGVLVKGGVHIESPGRLRAVALDKTGTLTKGEPAVVEVVPLNEHGEAELIGIAAGMEARSDHPLARAVLDFARVRRVPVRPAEDFQMIQGEGGDGKDRREELLARLAPLSRGAGRGDRGGPPDPRVTLGPGSDGGRGGGRNPRLRPHRDRRRRAARSGGRRRGAPRGGNRSRDHAHRRQRGDRQGDRGRDGRR